MYRKASFFLLLLLLILVAPLFGQTALKLEALLNKPAVTYSEAAEFVLEAAEKAALSDTEAFRFAEERKWLPKKAAPGNNARLNGISLLLLQAFDLKGGLFYSMTKSPRYAYRELVYKEVIQGRTDPEMTVSGEDFVFMVNRVLAIKETEADRAEAARIRAEEARRRAEEERLAREINAQLAAQRVADARARVTDEGVTISLSHVQFLPNSAILHDSEQVKLRRIADILKTVPENRILVTGHTALAGTREDQLRTSVERAQAVASYLVSLGARTGSEITVRGYGADRPIAGNNTASGMEANRRVEITILDR
jgi:outer membrane protein OmpA-like peptidoglycan-associated protein